MKRSRPSSRVGKRSKCDPLADIPSFGKSNPVSCLLCWKACLEPVTVGKVSDPWRFLKFPGAEGVTSLQKELSRWFIFQKLLGVPSEWFEQNWNCVVGGTGGGQSDAETREWCHVCSECLLNVVAEAWHIHRQMLELERRLEGIRRQVKKNIRSNASRHGIPESDSVTQSIRQLLMPDLFQGQPKQARPLRSVRANIAETESDLDGILHALETLSPEGEQENDSSKTWVPDNRQVKVEPHDGDPLSLEQETADELLSGGEDEWQPEDESPVSSEEISSGDEDDSDPDFKVFDIVQKSARGRRRLSKGSTQKRRRSGERNPRRICIECKAGNFKTAGELETHQKLHQKRKQTPGVDEEGRSLDCAQCTYPAKDHAELLVHMRLRHIAKLSQYECPLKLECDFAVGGWREVMRHVSKKHGDQAKQLLFQQYAHCDKCSFQAETPSELKAHQKKEHPEAPTLDLIWKCAECGVLCVTEAELNKHVSSEHLQVTRFECDVCGKGFWRHWQLLGHKRARHEKKRKTRVERCVCPICKLDFTSKWALDRHLTNHSKDVPGEVYKCNECDFSSEFFAVLRRHRQTHVVAEIRPWKCDQCGKAFKKRFQLTFHRQTVHLENQQPTQCPLCHRTYPSRGHMQSHLRGYCKIRKMIKMQAGETEKKPKIKKVPVPKIRRPRGRPPKQKPEKKLKKHKKRRSKKNCSRKSRSPRSRSSHK